MEKFPERLRGLGEKMKPVRSMTVTSQLMGLSPGALRRYERGERTPSLEELKLIANYYHIGLDDFCWNDGEQERKL